MDNRIRQIEVRDRSLVPAEAEVWITATIEQPTPTTELRGRLMGPRCPYASTVEVAYPLRPLPPGRAPEPAGLTRHVIIPEACLWEPESPFLYQGLIELWQDGQRCDRLTLCHGLRSIQLSERGLRMNGRLLALRGRCLRVCSDEEALMLRQAGNNLLVAPVKGSTLPLWEQADRLGFLMLGRVENNSEETRRSLETASRHPSCLGWILEDSEQPDFHLLPRAGLVGLLCKATPSKLALSVVHFLVGPSELANLGKPLLVTKDRPAEQGAPSVIFGGIV